MFSILVQNFHVNLITPAPDTKKFIFKTPSKLQKKLSWLNLFTNSYKRFEQK